MLYSFIPQLLVVSPLTFCTYHLHLPTALVLGIRSLLFTRCMEYDVLHVNQGAQTYQVTTTIKRHRRELNSGPLAF